MASIAEMIDSELRSWPGVTAFPHRFGGTKYHVNNHEIGHLYGNRQADLSFPSAYARSWSPSAKLRCTPFCPRPAGLPITSVGRRMYQQ